MPENTATTFDEFVDETRAELASYLRKFLCCPDDIREVSQEAYLKVFVALRRNSDREHTPRALLYTTARNVAISRLRHQQVVDRTSIAVTVSQEMQARQKSAEQAACDRENLQSLLSVINALTPQRRTVMLLRLVEGLSQKEIASRLGIAVSTVEKHLAQGLLQSRKLMAERAQTRNADEEPSRRAGVS